ncbi:MAG TPA: isoaspartyl peptidase/L-asparaginase [Gemmatimonadota bacterium]|nr:isoaspartyl peptidase/L-asparaginase [Gemmatimonadota bacterium]
MKECEPSRQTDSGRIVLRRLGQGCVLSLVLSVLRVGGPPAANAQDAVPDWVLVIHGGAGTIRREDMTPERERAYREAMTEALSAGAAVLEGGGPGLDAVETAIRVMEDSPLFNAGKGAVFTNSGANELDASIMDGATGKAGAVTGVRHVKNPISLARLVMEESVHVMLAREGAEEFALEQGVELVPAQYFYTESRWRALEREREQERESAAGGAPSDSGVSGSSRNGSLDAEDGKFGTVGAVALDLAGNLAAGTSTGGMTNKRWGRIGDSPIIGAGTYADNEMGCAVSSTGHGEFFIRNVVAYDICARKHYHGIPLADAADQVVMEDLVAQEADGGVIALDAEGNLALPFNTAGMYRGWIAAGTDPVIEFFRD